MKITKINENWQFTLVDTMLNKDLTAINTVWDSVSLPHDWTTDFPFEKINSTGGKCGFVKSGVGWYRNFLNFDSLPSTATLYFDGIFRNAQVYINGEEVINHSYGYTPFECDISKLIKSGVNLLSVRVDCSKEPSSRWFNGAGISRDVFLCTAEKTYIPYNGLYIYTEKKSDNNYLANIEISIEKPIKDDLSVEISICDCADNSVQVHKLDNVNENKIKTQILLENPKLWSVDSPNLYHCTVRLFDNKNSELIDEASSTFGVRTTEFIPNKGFFLNGENLKFKGECLHHDAGCMGSAVTYPMWKKRLLQLKKMGCNAVRTAHNPFPNFFYDLCDELGLMVMDECFDGWNEPKAEHDYGHDWQDNYKTDLTNFVLRDRNHPSIVLWSIGNEVRKMNTKTTSELMEIIRELDKTRKITCGVSNTGDVSDRNRALLDVAGYNDGGGACFIYEQDHENRPNQLLVATEAPHTYQTRGFYRTLTWWRDKNQPRIEIPNLTDEEIFFDQNINYSSSYDNSAVRTSAISSWGLVEKFPYLCGEFRWTGFDYLGEVFTGAWPQRMTNNGVIDTANFPKDHYYLYQSMWSDEPMIHILPHWTHIDMEQGTVIPVWVYTNCESAELFLNGESLGKKVLGDRKYLQWDVPYSNGKISGVAYNDNKIICETSHTTAKSPVNLVLNAEKLGKEKDKMLSQLSFNFVDENETFVPYADCVSGIYLENAALIGSDNGCPDDLTPPKSSSRRAFNGLGMYLLEYFEEDKASATVFSICSNRYFKNFAEITLSFDTVDFNDNGCSEEFEIRYTLDGNSVTDKSSLYNGKITVKDTTVISAALFKDGKPIITLTDTIFKGEPEKIIDLNHLNYDLDTEKPLGPFAKQIVGRWSDGHFDYLFEENGEVKRKVSNDNHQLLGYWWYDYPLDFLEAPDYAGTGEIWFISGEKSTLTLETQEAQSLNLDNRNKAISTAFGSSDLINFKR